MANRQIRYIGGPYDGMTVDAAEARDVIRISSRRHGKPDTHDPEQDGEYRYDRAADVLRWQPAPLDLAKLLEWILHDPSRRGRDRSADNLLLQLICECYRLQGEVPALCSAETMTDQDIAHAKERVQAFEVEGEVAPSRLRFLNRVLKELERRRARSGGAT